jgi:hypothetical protein
MKKKVLALSIAAMIGGAANAGVAIPVAAAAAAAANGNVAVDATAADTLAVTPDGIGHILLTPYFTTNNGNSTLLSIVNTDTVRGKAVKVRFRSAANSDDIFDFQVYMSPGDVWTATVSQAADGKSQLATTDKSCTLPFNVNQSFITDRLPSSLDTATKAAWTREGYVEIFNMADIIDDTAVTDDLFTAVKHVSGVAPCSTAKFDWTKLQADLTEANATANTNKIYFRAPTTGLMGGWTVINVSGASVAWSGNMTAIRANTVADGVAAAGRIVFSPQMASAAATPNEFTSDPLLRTVTVASSEATAARGEVHGAINTAASAVLSAANFDLPDLSTPYLVAAALNTAALGAVVGNTTTHPVAQANMVSGALGVTSVVNEYLTDTSITAATDWTFSMPTRRYGVAVNYGSTASNKRVYTKGNQYFRTGNTSFASNLVCVAASTLTSRDREEQTPTAGFVISPGTPSTLEFCGEASVLSFNSTNVLGAAVASKNIDATYRDGWLSVATPGLAALTGTTNDVGVQDNVAAAAAGRTGLPILGAAFLKASGPAVAGKSTNFSITNGHRNTR